MHGGGNFSWIAQDTDRPIYNYFNQVEKHQRTIYLIDDKGN